MIFDKDILAQNFYFEIQMISPLTGELMGKPLKDPESFGRRIELLSNYSDVPEELIIEELRQKGFVRVRNHLYKLIKNKQFRHTEVC